jgi:hypothetical protein
MARTKYRSRSRSHYSHRSSRPASDFGQLANTSMKAVTTMTSLAVTAGVGMYAVGAITKATKP